MTLLYSYWKCTFKTIRWLVGRSKIIINKIIISSEAGKLYFYRSYRSTNCLYSNLYPNSATILAISKSMYL